MAYKFNPFTGNLDTVMNPGTGTATIEFATDSGTANPTGAGVITVSGGVGVNTSGSGSTVTVNIGPMTDGQLLIGNTASSDPTVTTLTAGTGIVITNGNGSITIDSTGGFSWNTVGGTSATMVANNGYIPNNAGLVTLTLPATAVVGDTFQIVGKGAGGWRVAQNAGQTIHYISQDTTTGAGGRLDSTVRYNCVELVCVTANTDFVANDAAGNITVT